MNTVTEVVSVLESKYKQEFPKLCVVLGSGWNKVLEGVEVEFEMGYKELFGVGSGVPGHEGKLVIAKMGKVRVAFMAGRFHTYEGYTSEEVTRPLQAFAKLGMERVVVTAAAGALNEKYMVGDFVILSDIITMFCQSPLVGAQFIDLSEAFDVGMRRKAEKVCVEKGIVSHEGVYCYAHGPHFETPADKMMLRHLGADVVGMSTVPETIMARSLGIKVLGLSFVTNLAFVKHDHKDVLAAADKGSAQMVELLKGIIEEK